MRSPSGPAKTVTSKSADVFKPTEIDPRITNCQKTWPNSRSTNCGMKERKKRAVLGFKTSVAMPCQKGLRAEVDGLMAIESASCRASTIMRTPKNPRYAAPAYFTVAKATAERARIRETPAAAASTCVMPPTNGPGAMARSNAALRKSGRRVVSSMVGRFYLGVLRPPSRLLKNYFRMRYLTPAAKAAIENMAVIAALKRCATQDRRTRRVFPELENQRHELVEGLYAWKLLVAIGAGSVEQERLHAGGDGPAIIHRVHISNVETGVWPGIHGLECGFENDGVGFLMAYDAGIGDGAETVADTRAV